MNNRRTRRRDRTARRKAWLVAACAAALLASPALCANAQAAGIDAICTASGSVGFMPALNNNTVATSIAITISGCLDGSGLTGGEISTPTPLTATGCFPLFSVTGNTAQIAWNNGSTSTVSAHVNFNVLTGVPQLYATVIAGTLNGDTLTPLPLILPIGLCGLGGTTSITVPVLALLFTS